MNRTPYFTINKARYIFITFFFGLLGTHRFMRGQIRLGILMATVGWWATLGIWPLTDFILSFVMLRRYSGENFVFTADGKFAQISA